MPHAVIAALRALARACLCVAVSSGAAHAQALPPTPPGYIAHGGGGLDGIPVSNSRQALDAAVAAGHTFIEVDFCWTRDDRLVLLHDWDTSLTRLFVAEPGVLSRDEFRAAPSRHGLDQLTAEDLLDWLAVHPDVVLVTDFKGRPVEGLQRLAELARTRDVETPGAQVSPRTAPLLAQILPQIYAPDQHDAVLAAGYPAVILTLYAVDISDADLLAYAAARRPFAVTMPLPRARGPLSAALAAGGTPALTHTVNRYTDVVALAAGGVVGVYTDDLSPALDARARDPSAWPAWTAQASGRQVELTAQVQAFVPPPGFGPRLALTLTNTRADTGAGNGTALLMLRHQDGTRAAQRRLSLAPGEVRDVDVTALAAESGAGSEQWLALITSRDVRAETRLQLAGRPDVVLPLAGLAATRHGFAGPGDGLGGQVLALVAPRGRPAQVQVLRRVAGRVDHDEQVSIPPDGLALLWLPAPGPGPVQLEVSGNPVVAVHLRHDPTVSFLR